MAGGEGAGAGPAGAEEAWSFPILAEEFLVECLEELDLPLSPGELFARPTYEGVRLVFERLLVLLTGCPREGLAAAVPEAAAGTMRWPELHADSLRAAALCRNVGQLMEAAGVKDFSPARDLYKPEPQRLQRALSAIINFAKFREEKLARYEELRDAAREAERAGESLREERDRLGEAIAAEREDRGADRGEVEQRRGENAALGAQLQALNREQSDLQAECKALKQEQRALEQDIAQRQGALQAAGSERERLQGSVVQSPERLQRALDDLDAQLESQRAEVAQARERLAAVAARRDCSAAARAEVEKAATLMDELGEEVQRWEGIAEGVKACRAQISANEADLIHLKASREHFQQQHSRLCERMERLERSSQLKREAAAAILEEARGEQQQILSELGSAGGKIQEQQGLAQALEAGMADVRARHAQEVSSITGKYEQLCGAVQKYHARLEQAMVTPVPSK